MVTQVSLLVDKSIHVKRKQASIDRKAVIGSGRVRMLRCQAIFSQHHSRLSSQCNRGAHGQEVAAVTTRKGSAVDMQYRVQRPGAFGQARQDHRSDLRRRASAVQQRGGRRGNNRLAIDSRRLDLGDGCESVECDPWHSGLVPIMETQKEPEFVVNTASIAGLMKGHHSAAYATTKHAVVALTEQLAVEFERTGSLLKAAVLCTSWVNTRINEGGRNRPGDLRNPVPANAPRHPPKRSGDGKNCRLPPQSHTTGRDR